ncbi:MAG: YicC family protein [Clostridiales Family XIII bacterium]|nr:YicC family protein [Clostridiales Family XIII bacterium]
MTKSMTGFGRGDKIDSAREVHVEIRSVNHRYAEYGVRLPRGCAFVEDDVKQLLRKNVRRGKVDVNVFLIDNGNELSNIVVNETVAEQYVNAYRQLQEIYNLSGDVSIQMLALQQDVLKTVAVDSDEDALKEVILNTVNTALVEFNEMRKIEGAKLVEDLLLHAEKIEAIVSQIEERMPLLPGIYSEKLRERIEDLTVKLSGDLLDDRLSLEIAVFADKCNVTEEIVRLKSHLIQMRDILNAEDDEPRGKKLDFLLQEMNRETNTIGSKASDLKVTDHMLELKSEIEIIREQVQNIE